MRPIYIDVYVDSSIGLDRLATWNEIHCAMDSDFSGCARNLAEDAVSLAILSEMSDAVIN